MIYEGIVNWSLRHRLLVLLASALLLLLGLYRVRTLPVDVLPDLTRPTVSVQLEAPGMAAEDAESQLSLPVEAALSALPDVERVRSVSSTGLAVIYAEFAWGSDVYRNRQLVAERLETVRAQLPENAQPRIGPLSSLMGEVMLIGLHAGDGSLDAMQLRDLADWRLRPALLAVPGVAQVLVIGGESRQYEIRPDPQRLRLHELSLQQLIEAARGYGRDYGAGYADSGGRELALRSHGRPFSLEELGDLAVAWRGNAPLRLSQVAELGVGARLKRGDAGVDAQPAVILSIQKQPGVDSLRLTQDLQTRLRELDAGLPAGLQRVELFRQADFISRALHNVREALYGGALLVLLVLYVFLRSARATAVSLAAIPLSLLAALLVLRAFGFAIDTMTLGGLAIAVGELVDDAVVGVENILRRLRQRREQQSVMALIAQATIEVRSGVLYATLIIVLVFVPLFALQGIEARLFAPLGLAYIAAILASLLVAVSTAPVLALWLLDQQQTPQEPRWLQALKAAYRRALQAVLQQPRRVLLPTLLLALLASACAFTLPRTFLPPFNEGTLTVNLIAQPGISLAESDRLGRMAEAQLLQIPEVLHVGRRTGRAELDEHAEGVHYAELDLALREGGRSREAVVAQVRERLSALPANIAIGQPISHRLDHLLSGVRAPLVVKLFGEDLNVLQSLAAQVRAQLAALPGLAEVQIEAQQAVPQLDIHVDTRRAAQYGLAAPAVQQTLSQLSLGLPLSQIIEGERRYELVLRLPPEARQASALPALLLDAPAGPVPLAQIAEFRTHSGANQILRENLRRRLVVTAYPADSGFAAASVEAQARLARLPLPQGYTLKVEGQVQAQQAAQLRIGLLSLLSLALMLLVLYGRYRSWTLSLIVLGNVPLALIGGVLALKLSATPLSVASLIGFITLAGIAARNGILKLSHFLNLALHGDESFGTAQVLRGSAERLTPVLMTALIAALALLPLVVAGQAPGKEILHPVALVIFGGLISSTLLDSFLTPWLYLRFGAGATQRLLRETARQHAY
ncbi:heavy-metal exporter, HME family [Solimonas aquatica]|uniref:Heavy-metal exporter, HME family n=1 Tax=Solimonas aquatica TaxID=489703 RepID=A0A1H9FPR5_9GAMM|nr:efflux RND transporter permease subunit [Solimonas aquatica]SEQ39886.1 heavy-metal exporter, HME family [Solimonas aquatica]